MMDPRLGIRRLLSRLPESVKTVLRPLGTGRGESATPLLEPWDRPLIADQPISWPTKDQAPDRWHEKAIRTSHVDLKCLLVTESMDASGMDEFVAFLARRLPSVGIEAAVLLPADSNGWREGALFHALREEGVCVLSARASEGAEWIRAFRPDVVYSHASAEWPLQAAFANCVPAIEALHGMHNLFDASPAIIERRRALLHGVVAVSELVRSQYLEIHPLAKESNTVTIPNGVDPQRIPTVSAIDARAALGLRNEFLFISPSRYSLQKNVYGLVDAFLEVAAQRTKAHLIVCGRLDDNDYTRQVLALRDRSAYGDRVHLRGNTDRIDVVLAAADAFVLNSFFEGWSLASMEALGAGLPVIVSEVGGAREQLTHGPAKGVLIPNPLGDPLKVNWNTMSSARFVRQVNRADLVEALISMIDRSLGLADKEDIASDSLERFSMERCLHSHASVLRLAAQRQPIGRSDGNSDPESGGSVR